MYVAFPSAPSFSSSLRSQRGKYTRRSNFTRLPLSRHRPWDDADFEYTYGKGWWEVRDSFTMVLRMLCEYVESAHATAARCELALEGAVDEGRMIELVEGR